MSEAREKEWKATTDVDALRRKKGETQVELRKQKRNEKLNEKRQLGGTTEADLNKMGSETLAKLPAPTLKDLPTLINQIYSNNPEDLQIGAIQIRKLLSSSKNQPPLEEVIQTGIVPRLVQLMQYDDDKLKMECAWTLTNLASGTSQQTQVVVDANSVPVFIALLSDKPVVAEQCMWALGNIAGDRPELRDITLEMGILPPLLHLLAESVNRYLEYQSVPGEEVPKEVLTMMRTCTWTLSNLTRGKNPPVMLEKLKPTLPLISRLICVGDKDTLADACWACSFISDLGNGVQEVIDNNMTPRLVALLTYPSPEIVSPTLRAIGNIVAGNDKQTQQIIQDGALPCLLNLLKDSKPHIRKEACWAISNITAGTRDQVQQVLEAKIMPELIKLIMEDAEPRVRKEASWAVANAAHSCSDQFLYYLVDLRAIEALSQVLSLSLDVKTLCVVLLALKKILAAGQRLPLIDGQNQYALKLEECRGAQIIETLKSHQNMKVYERAVRVLKYLNPETDEVIEAVQEPEQNNGMYQFNVPQNMPNSGFNF